jgi:hypothetical protein
MAIVDDESAHLDMDSMAWYDDAQLFTMRLSGREGY